MCIYIYTRYYYLLPLSQMKHDKEFCQVKKIQKSEKDLEVGGWVKPQLGFIVFFGNLVFLCCFLLMYMFKKKIEYGGGWVWSGQSEFFSDFWIFFNFTKPLSINDLSEDRNMETMRGGNMIFYENLLLHQTGIELA